MNMQKRIEQNLSAAPKPPAPEALLDKLKNDLALEGLEAKPSGLRRWFTSAGGAVSGWRVAAAAIIAIAVLLPLSYGATKAVKHFITTFEAEFNYGDNRTYKVASAVGSSSGDIQSEEDAFRAQQEFYELYKEGKAEEIEPGLWVATLSNGEGFGYSGDPELLALSDSERKEQLKEQFDEIEELRKAGDFERTFIKEEVVNGIRIRHYKDTFTLSNGKVVSIGAGESVKDEN